MFYSKAQTRSADVYEISLITSSAETGNIAELLAPPPLMAARFESAEAFLIHIMRHPVRTGVVRIVYLSIALEGMSGIEAFRQIQKLEPETRVILLADHAEATTVLDAWHNGASDFILAPYTDQKIIDSMQRVVHSTEKRPPEILASPTDDYRKVYETLTRREREIGQLTAEGLRNQQIADQLHISLATVKMHRANLFRKLNLGNAAQLSAFLHKCQLRTY